MREEIMFKKKKNENNKTQNINDKIKEQKNVLMDEGEKKERKIMKRIALVCALVAVVGGSFYGGMSYGRLLPASHRYYFKKYMLMPQAALPLCSRCRKVFRNSNG